ncbi:MAG: ribonuclease III domain-containing protein [Bacilli bacterium]
MINKYNILVYAYIGDGYYELKIRTFLIKKEILKVNSLQKEGIAYVSGYNQSRYLDKLIENNFFSSIELAFIKKCLNYKITRHPKAITLLEYKKATALEAIIGYYVDENNEQRANEIINEILRRK